MSYRVTESLTYTSGTGGETVDLLASRMHAGETDEVRRREWGYTISTHSLKGVKRTPAERKLKVLSSSRAESDMARRVFDRDVQNGTPGILSINGWSQRCLVTKTTPDIGYLGAAVEELTVVLLDGCWTRLVTREYRPRTAAGGYGWLDLPTGFDFDLGPSLPTSDVTVDCTVRPNVRLVLYGPCVNPYVIVGGNRYAVNRTIAEGERIEVDGRYKTIVQVMSDGTRVSCFADGVRTGGEGGGSYIFERLPVSQYPIAVSWDNSFGFDLCWYEEESMVPWER